VDITLLTESSHGQLLLELPHPRADGATHLLLDPLELAAGTGGSWASTPAARACGACSRGSGSTGRRHPRHRRPRRRDGKRNRAEPILEACRERYRVTVAPDQAFDRQIRAFLD